MEVGFINHGDRDRPAISLTFNGRPVGDSRKYPNWMLAREEAQLYFEGKRGDINVSYTLDAKSLLLVM